MFHKIVDLAEPVGLRCQRQEPIMTTDPSSLPSVAAALPTPERRLSDEERKPCEGTGLVAFTDESLRIICPACGLGFGVHRQGEIQIPSHLPPWRSPDGA